MAGTVRAYCADFFEGKCDNKYCPFMHAECSITHDFSNYESKAESGSCTVCDNFKCYFPYQNLSVLKIELTKIANHMSLSKLANTSVIIKMDIEKSAVYGKIGIQFDKKKRSDALKKFGGRTNCSKCNKWIPKCSACGESDEYLYCDDFVVLCTDTGCKKEFGYLNIGKKSEGKPVEACTCQFGEV